VRSTHDALAPATVLHAAGARSSFVRVAPVVAELERRGGFRQVVVDLSPVDTRLDDAARAETGVPAPAHVIDAGPGGRGERTGRMLCAFERVLIAEQPDVVVLAGDFDATVACALAAAKLRIPVAHLEAGLRSWDWGMPEEINRVLTDQLSDALFCHSAIAADNLRAEGVGEARVHHVGSTVVDWLRAVPSTVRDSSVRRALGLERYEYVVVALHKRATVDAPGSRTRLAAALSRMAEGAPVLVPSPARTLEALPGVSHRVRRLGPLSCRAFAALAGESGAIVTDSGSVQEEASALGVPCYTLRPGTERQITLTHGTNHLVDDVDDLAAIVPSGRPPTPCAIPLWDGHAAGRIADAVIANFVLCRQPAGAAR
jgi:UDP-N-acetylglucosamine 2-epimerase (non-hydrolysing)